MIKNITIGSDPEFIFEHHGTFLNPHDVLRPKRLSVCGIKERNCRWCNKTSFFCSGTNSPEIGTDGDLGELRPKPAQDPLKHVENIQELINAIDFLSADVVLKGGTVQHSRSIGGHIHIGADIEDRLNFAIYLSHYCGIPLRKIENPSDLKKRGLGRYTFGKFGAHDYKDYGVEWRMPASWLVSKEIATAALCLAYVVAKNYVPEYVSMKHPQYVGYLKTKIPTIIKTIEEMKGYKTYRKEIEPLIHMIENKEIWDTNLNIMESWK